MYQQYSYKASLKTVHYANFIPWNVKDPIVFQQPICYNGKISFWPSFWPSLCQLSKHKVQWFLENCLLHKFYTLNWWTKKTKIFNCLLLIQLWRCKHKAILQQFAMVGKICFTFGRRNSPGNSTSAVFNEKLLRNLHFSSIRNDLANRSIICTRYIVYWFVGENTCMRKYNDRQHYNYIVNNSAIYTTYCGNIFMMHDRQQYIGPRWCIGQGH